jgi:hypothetical protein
MDNKGIISLECLISIQDQISIWFCAECFQQIRGIRLWNEVIYVTDQINFFSGRMVALQRIDSV